uniref:Uncharacterized protein n=1 Tax=Lepeophtheirus salmonis TaxID=72036 RepID=A0A0K2TMJ1_LEPSM
MVALIPKRQHISCRYLNFWRGSRSHSASSSCCERRIMTNSMTHASLKSFKKIMNLFCSFPLNSS